jgi:hypothetical protein
MFVPAGKAHLFQKISRVNCQERNKRFHFFRGARVRGPTFNSFRLAGPEDPV